MSGTDEERISDARVEVARTREELSRTVSALAAKTDVKARAREQVGKVKATVRETPPAIPAAAVTAIAGLALGRWAVRRRSARRRSRWQWRS